MHPKWAWILAALSGFIIVAAGAFGAHALAGSLSPRDLEVFHTAVRYQAWHTLAAMCVLAWRSQRALRGQTLVVGLWFAGIVLFSGSLYGLILSGARPLGIVTPVGGVLLMAGWLVLAWSAWRQRPATGQVGTGVESTEISRRDPAVRKSR